MKQTWATKGAAKPAWDIAERKQVWKEDAWVPMAGRHADVYVLALHDVEDETADQAEEGIAEVRLVPWPRVLDMVRDGTITDGETHAALLLAALALVFGRALRHT